MERQKSVLRNQFNKNIQQFVQKYSTKFLSQKILQLLDALNWNSFQTVAVYAPLLTEVPLTPLVHKYPHISWVYPRLFKDKKFVFVRTQKETLFKISYKSFQEPESMDICPIRDIDLFLVSGLSFDRQMRRLGRGLGFYDHVLAQASNAVKVGVCWSVQVSNESLPQESHDQLMDILVTENWLLYSQNFLKQTINKKVS